MKRVKMLVGAVVVAGVLAVPATAFADSCTNVSRDTHAPGGTTVEMKGNWIWLPGPGIWGFAPPGGPDSTGLGFPGANGNYGVNKPDALLSASNNCPPGNNTARQTTNGIQSGCVS